MCRLFGLHAGSSPVAATFWLLDAPDSLREQSRRNPDGAGIGVFGSDGRPVVDKQPIAAWEDREFATSARELRGTTFVAHVRYASTGAHVVANTHPFLQDDRLFAHNGVILGLSELDEYLTENGDSDLVAGDTDSERVFALITGETRRHGGDVGAGLTAAVRWVSDHLPVYALNLVMGTAADLWALRYPDTHELYVLERRAGGSVSGGSLDARSSRIRASSAELASAPSVLVASEPMDDDPGWRLLGSGELLHVGADLRTETSTPLGSAPPRHLLRLSDLEPAAAASQHPRSTGAA
jgi:predicted glutamine amidotransferase